MDRLFSNKKINKSRQDIKGYYCYTCDSYCQASCTKTCNGSCTGGCKGTCIGTCNGVSTYS